MKTPRILLAVLPLAFLAASSLPRHQAFGPLRFGMTNNEAATTFSHINQLYHSKSHHEMTAAEARALFVTNGNLRVARMPDFDRACPVFVAYKAEPFVSQVTLASNRKAAENYDTQVKQTWEDFQDIGDCKFQRKGTKGIFPPIQSLNAESPEGVTDTWETEGIRIELSLRYFDPATSPGAVAGPVQYNVILRATEIAPATAAK